MFSWLAPLTLPVIQRAVVTLLIAGTTFSLLGVFIISLQLTVIRFALLHVGLLGAVIAATTGFDPLLGGILAIILSAVLLGPIGDVLQLPPNVMSALFMTGSLAIAFIFLYKTGVPAMDLFSLFAGSALTIRSGEAWLTSGLGIVICFFIFWAYRELQAVLYDREFASSLGIPARLIFYTLLGTIGITIAIAIRLVGALLVDGIILLPAMIALPLARSLGQALALAALFGFLISITGITTSLVFDWPIGASVGVAGVSLLVIGHGMLRPFLSHWRQRRTPTNTRKPLTP